MLKDKKTNNEKSPYLLQHVYNLVDWYAWGEEAFEKAKREDKPIFLSRGYSTCHWCHVMERESFEDTEVADILNKYFISIKVDREERPDIDSIYMSFCQTLTGQGGWPLTIIIKDEGNFEGKSIPNLIQTSLEEIENNRELEEKLEVCRDKLFKHRLKRIHPHKDDKILTAWNGLMIAALSYGGRVLNNEDYIHEAKKAFYNKSPNNWGFCCSNSRTCSEFEKHRFY